MRLVLLCVCLLTVPSAPSATNSGVGRIGWAGQQTAPLAGRWQYLQLPDKEGEVLDLFVAAGADGTIRFEIGERSVFHKRPALSELGAVGTGGFIRSRMRFSGWIERGALIVHCAGDDGACPDATLRFKAQCRVIREGVEDTT